MKIQNDAMVSLQYELYSTEDGELIEKTKDEEPLVFLFGKGMMLEAFEANLLNLEQDATFDFKLTPEQAYGNPSEDAVQELDKNIFRGADGEIDNEVIKVGNIVPLMTKDGQRFQATVLEIKDDVVALDFNHPLAGETLHFKGSIVEVREATEAEIASMFGGGCGCGDEGNCDNNHGEGSCCEENNGGCGCH